MAIIIEGKKIAASLLENLQAECGEIFAASGIKPCLAIILVGNDPASRVYVTNKIKAARFVGIDTKLIEPDSSISEKDLLTQIEALNQDSSVSGIIVQLPLPSHIRNTKVIEAIAPDKDVDGFHPVNVGRLYSEQGAGFVPCTALGCLKLIESCNLDLAGKNVVMIGRSSIVGRPLAALLLKKDCTVTICHSKTRNLAEITRKADIVISAIGKPKYLTKEYFSSHAIIIDVGISRIETNGNKVLCGDVDFDDLQDHASYITPVPGGVGPMTVAYLLTNTLKAFHNNQRIS